MRGTRENNDSLQTYLGQMGQFPRLTAAQETEAADRLILTRRRLRASILSSDFVLRKVMGLLDRLQRRKLRLDHTMGFSSNDSAERRRVLELLPKVLDLLRTTLRDNRRDFAQVVKRSLSKRDRRAAWRRMVLRRRRAADAINEIGVRTRHLQRWQRQLETLIGQIDVSRKHISRLRQNETADGLGEARQRLHALMRQAVYSPATARRHLNCCRSHERDYDAAKHFLVSSNLRLVVALAKRYRNRGVSFLDLIQEGNSGLLQAVDRWEPTGSKFSTYATWWARQAIKEAVHIQPRTIRLPEQVVERLRRIQGATRSLVQQHGFRPDLEAIASEVGMSAAQAEKMLRIHHEPFSLDQPIDALSENDASMSENIVDYRWNESHEDLSREQLKARLADVLTELNERQRAVISLRFGLLDGSQRTLDEVGKLLSLTREGVRQIELRAVERLRHPARSRLLRGFLDFDDMHKINQG
ncbi:MAG TPA: sigma-70 family RNA polymerase sigma factor [Pirellulales bacterium]|nr:sigma-70 family RNA polymerase sigma factor [Pirellulales bacterium]